ncbi:MAG: hypothetical protein KDE47_11715 [Caldilineaceae bacterium]|nr:hypothetical protein [Caldilineaceae bacterium]
MNLAILIVEGSDDVLQSASSLLGREVSTWKKGAPKWRGGVNSTSGFSATIADYQNPNEMVVAIRDFVTECQTRQLDFSDLGLSADLSIGVTVGDSEQFIACLDFSASDLVSLGAIGVGLSIAAYPTSDEANEYSQNA